MIIGVFVKYFKIYQASNYIPLTQKENLCGLVGENGVGKSSILEALDCFFNGRQWNYNIQTKKSGLAKAAPAIVPIFLVSKAALKITESGLKSFAERYSNAIWNIEEKDFPSGLSRTNAKAFVEHKNALLKNIRTEDYYLLPIGIDYENKAETLFNAPFLKKIKTIDPLYAAEEVDFTGNVKSLYDYVVNAYEYVYFPKDSDVQQISKLESRELQVLMGKTLIEIIERAFPSTRLKQINKDLEHELTELSKSLKMYSFRTPTDRQTRIKKIDVHKLILEAFFSIRKLHRKEGTTWIELNNLSSGEKQKAVIDVIDSLITSKKINAQHIILALDEPESSLHISACLEHFIKLFNASDNLSQLLFATHWYGFLPIAENCNVTTVNLDDDEGHRFDCLSVENYREAIKQSIRVSGGKLPYDLRLKSINDFIQSIIPSLLHGDGFNWLFCEGSSEKIYLDYHFKELKKEKQLRIVPVGGIGEIKKIYTTLMNSIDEYKNDLLGKVYFLVDTDADFVEINSVNNRNIKIKRLVNDMTNQVTKLVDVNSNPKAPITAIEDVLNGKAFANTLAVFQADYACLAGLDLKNKSEILSACAMDLRVTESIKLEDFFGQDNNKYRFAKEYVKELDRSVYTTPAWIEEVIGFFR